MTFKRKLVDRAILSSLLLAPFTFCAQQETALLGGEAKDVEVLAVTGILPTRFESLLGSFSIIDEAYLEARRPISNLERVRAVPGINVVADGSMGFDTNIGFRGQDPRRSAKAMIMEDGVPLQLAPYTDPVVHHTTSKFVVNRIEDIKGAGQVLYGPQTLDGRLKTGFFYPRDWSNSTLEH